MLKLLSPLEIQSNKWRAELAENGIQGGWNYYLDHAFLYEEMFPPAQQTNLSIADAESTFNDVFEGPVDFYELVKEYKSSSMDLFDRHRKRFGTDEFSYIVGASRQIKS